MRPKAAMPLRGNKEAVFRIVDSETVKGAKTVYSCRVGHTKDDVPPVPERDKGIVSRYVAACAAKRARRRKGSFIGSKEETTASPEEEEISNCAYPMVKGLLFCPEKSIYLSRDEKAAQAIARLCTTELLGKPRPAPFHRSFKLP